jgi:hypothetical protein
MRATETVTVIANVIAIATMTVSEAANSDPSPCIDFAHRVYHEITMWDAAEVKGSSRQTLRYHAGLNNATPAVP